jgi:PAS domain S-box-containing protein
VEATVFKEEAAELSLIADIAEKGISMMIDHEKNLLADITTDSYIRADIEDVINKVDSEKVRAMNVYLQTKKNLFDQAISAIDIFDLNGLVVASSNETRIGHQDDEEELKQEYNFDQARVANLGEVILGEVVEEKNPIVHEAPTAHLSTPLISPAGKVIGVMVAHLDFDTLNKSLNSQAADKAGLLSDTSDGFKTLNIYLINKSGLILTDTRDTKSAALRKKADSLAVQKCFSEGREVSGRYINYLKAPVVGATSCSKKNWWMLVAEVDESEILIDLVNLRNQIFIITLLVIILITLVVIFFGNRLLRSLRDNLRVIKEISQGNYKAHLNYLEKSHPRGVIGQLGVAINQMTESLDKSYRDIKDSEEKYRTLIDSSADCIKLLDENGKLLHLSRGGLNEHGFKSQAEALNWDYLKTIEPEFLPRIKETLSRVKKGEIIDFDVRHTSDPKIKGASNREWCNMTFSPVRNNKGVITNILVISRDITEKKKMENRREELDTLKNKFITIVSHQLRTPLSAVRWNLEAFLGKQIGRITKGQEEILKITYQATMEIISRVNDLIIAIDIEKGGITLEKEMISLSDTFMAVYKEMKPRLVLKNINLLYAEPKKSLPLVSADVAKMRVVFEKILDNAIRYNKEGGEIIVGIFEQVELSGARSVVFVISDKGIGIPRPEQHYIFNRFYRAPNALIVETDASGLGLYIAQNYLKAHGATIDFVSSEDQGSTFWFDFPLI